MQDLGSMSDNLTTEFEQAEDESVMEPFVRVYRQDGEDTGIAFHGVPGGHEFNSFVIGLYNAAGPGQALDKQLLEQIQAINQPINIKILISLSCTMCPELVMAAQRIAAENPLITAGAFNINHFPQLREQYKVMSVPCLIVNDEFVSFGKKNVSQLLDFIKESLDK